MSEVSFLVRPMARKSKTCIGTYMTYFLKKKPPPNRCCYRLEDGVNSVFYQIEVRSESMASLANQ